MNEIKFTEKEKFVLVAMVNAFQNQALRTTDFKVMSATMSSEAKNKWIVECIEEHDMLMTLKAKILRL